MTVTTVDEQQSGFAMRVAMSKIEPRRDVARRTEVRARLAGPSARLCGDHCDSQAVREVMRPIWLAA